MEITIQIQTDNAAFEDNLRREVERILQHIRMNVLGWGGYALCPGDDYPIHDINGNTCGHVQIREQ